MCRIQNGGKTRSLLCSVKTFSWILELFQLLKITAWCLKLGRRYIANFGDILKRTSALVKEKVIFDGLPASDCSYKDG